ncbi:MAG: hypothetical protein G8D84_21685 [gamma proteobacterium symbiont of Clathrolucina costata]
MAYQYELSLDFLEPPEESAGNNGAKRGQHLYLVRNRGRPQAQQYELPLAPPSPPDEEVEWTDWEIEQLRLYVLKKTLSLFHDRRNCLKARTEALDWLMDDSIHPFSYVVCCEVAGVDPDTMRAMVVDAIKRNNDKGP